MHTLYFRIFYFSRRVFAKHYTLLSCCRIFGSRSRSRKIRLLLISKIFVYCCHSDIDFIKNCTLTNFNSYSITGENFIAETWIASFKAIEKYRYDLRRTVSKHHKRAHLALWTWRLFRAQFMRAC